MAVPVAAFCAFIIARSAAGRHLHKRSDEANKQAIGKKWLQPQPLSCKILPDYRWRVVASVIAHCPQRGGKIGGDAMVSFNDLFSYTIALAAIATLIITLRKK